MSSSRAKCQQFQDKMAKRRDRDFWHQQKWGQQVEYYQKFEKTNARFENWTSPRYYESNTEMVERLRKERDKKELLEKRRERLKKLLAEDDATYEIEVMMNKAKIMEKERVKLDEIPTEILKDINVGMKIEDDEKKRKEAELKLYQQWRRDNLVLREAERNKATKDIKLTWLDQQIEKRMRKEKEVEECKKYLRERDENIQKQKYEEQIISDEIQKKNEELKADLLKQIEEIKTKQKESETLRELEEEEMRKQAEIFEFQEKVKQQEIYKRNKEIAIYNLKQHKLKLKNLSKLIEENLTNEQDLIADIIRSKAADKIQDLKTKEEVKTALDEFLKFTREQKELEKKRRSYMDFIFDSEAKVVFEKQREIWENEELSRKNLLRDVLDTIEKQISENVKKSRDRQRELISEREKTLEAVETYEREIEENKKLESERKSRIKEEIDEEVRRKQTREKKLRELEKGSYDVELEGMKKEEERLKKEILKIQRSHAPVRYVKKKPWY